MRGLAPLFIVLVMSACAASGGSSATAEPTASPSEQSTPSEAPSGEPTADPGDGVMLTGVLGADSIEGGCGYLQNDDGTRYEVIYPDGWELSLRPLELRAPDGTVVARGGDEVTVVGEVAGDMASICQIGPIFRADAVQP